MHAALYGASTETPGVTALGAVETLAGGVLLFLLILGVRYTLRVR